MIILAIFGKYCDMSIFSIKSFSNILFKNCTKYSQVISNIPLSISKKRRFLQAFNKGYFKDYSQKFSGKVRRLALSKFYSSEMDDPKVLEVLEPLQLSVKEQGDRVRELKANKASANDVKIAVTELKLRKKKLEDKVLELSSAIENDMIDRVKLEDLLKQKFFYDMSFSIYGGVAGLYDYGPMGCAMKSNILQIWRNHFVMEEQMLEVDCSIMTPEHVLKASGHVDKFADVMVKDTKTGECFRTDHLIEAHFEKVLMDKKTKPELKKEINSLLPMIESMSIDGMEEVIIKYNIKSPVSGNDLGKPHEFNLMFATSIGPSGYMKGFLRPETSQGIFVNFKRLLDFNQGKLPFSAAQIGMAFRNEISPRSGLIRVREFQMAEIEHFHDPAEKDHPKFFMVEDIALPLYSATYQMDGKLARNYTIKQAVDIGLISNQTLAYFMGRVYLFLVKVGVDPKKIRFRQHMNNEMAHYAKDCWDAELKTSYGWVECVGCADRSCFDLQSHSKASGVNLVAEKNLPEPILEEVVEAVANKSAVGKVFRKEGKSIIKALESLSLEELCTVETNIKDGGSYKLATSDKEYELNSSMLSVKRSTKKTYVEEIVPSVVEPSFGIGRIMYAILEHSFRIREGDEQRTYLSLPAAIAPYKCSILPISNKSEFNVFIKQLSLSLTEHDISYRVDATGGSIGRRYARTDQIAISYAITIDFDTVNAQPPTATLRERDSMKQIRAKLEDIPLLIQKLSLGKTTWEQVMQSYPVFEQQDTT